MEGNMGNDMNNSVGNNMNYNMSNNMDYNMGNNSNGYVDEEMEKTFVKELRKDSNVNSLLVILFFVLSVALTLIFELVTRLIVGDNLEKYGDVLTLGSFLMQFLVTVPLAMFIYHKIRGKKKGIEIKSCFRKPEMSGKWIAKWVIITAGMSQLVSILSNVFFTTIMTLFNVELEQISFTSNDTFLSKFTMFTAMAVLAPIFEELFFRGTFFKNIEKYGGWSMLIISGLFFGLIHANYPQILLATTLGVFTCLILVKTKSIYPCIIAHFCLNIFGAIQSVLLSKIDLDKLTQGNTEYITENLLSIMLIGIVTLAVLGLAIAGLVLFIIEVVKHKESFIIENHYPQIATKKKVLAYFTAPLTVITVLLLLALTVYNAI